MNYPLGEVCLCMRAGEGLCAVARQQTCPEFQNGGFQNEDVGTIESGGAERYSGNR